MGLGLLLFTSLRSAQEQFVAAAKVILKAAPNKQQQQQPRQDQVLRKRRIDPVMTGTKVHALDWHEAFLKQFVENFRKTWRKATRKQSRRKGGEGATWTGQGRAGQDKNTEGGGLKAAEGATAALTSLTAWQQRAVLPKTVTSLLGYRQQPAMLMSAQNSSQAGCSLPGLPGLSGLSGLSVFHTPCDITQRVFPLALHFSFAQKSCDPRKDHDIPSQQNYLQNNAIWLLNYIHAFLLWAGVGRGRTMGRRGTRRATRNCSLRNAKPRDQSGRYSPPFRPVI
ncbi:hypothetical protein BO99DRAFT_97521 [Aspergillus violaceofuscus CBS 115571]|uniref:Uncharacterized protein n=1 Tax=Aspergillus violaceofuscus (strain CBS 115571) TaxID=1450538 RepID=A0A2V5H9P2_ASPV1|nr:hypothetical protein BO99DRAFT_97521 [Aspergillus violaceofuscus CBS 115571]